MELRFFDASGDPLAYEVESWNPSGESAVWVRLEEIELDDDHFFMEYGDPPLPTGEDPAAVWSGRYIGVWRYALRRAVTTRRGPGPRSVSVSAVPQPFRSFD